MNMKNLSVLLLGATTAQAQTSHVWVAMPDGTTRPQADLNGDGEVNISDVTQLVNVILGKGSGICPDAHHPHAIDLGLPSGTKWACCNVGALSPEWYGGYYAWGETQTKYVYEEDTYQYCNKGLYVNIGSDIAGTHYDAATANWGASWCMPSLTQIEELFYECSHEYTQQNGVNGRLFTGPNGNRVFLPAAGYRSNGELYGEGSFGDYWSSSLYEGYPFYNLNNVYCLAFYSDNDILIYGGGRNAGRTVRPVRKN